MNPKELIVKCYAEQESNYWIAICLNFNLASQANSFEEAKSKLEIMIIEYVYDALVGEDKIYAEQLLSRQASLSFWLKYYFIKIKSIVSSDKTYTYTEIMPLILA